MNTFKIDGLIRALTRHLWNLDILVFSYVFRCFDSFFRSFPTFCYLMGNFLLTLLGPPGVRCAPRLIGVRGCRLQCGRSSPGNSEGSCQRAARASADSALASAARALDPGRVPPKKELTLPAVNNLPLLLKFPSKKMIMYIIYIYIEREIDIDIDREREREYYITI